MTKEKKKFYKKWWFWLLIIIVIGSSLGDDGEEVPEEENQQVVSEIGEDEIKDKEDLVVKGEIKEADTQQEDMKKNQEKDDNNTEVLDVELDRKEEISDMIKSRISDGEYKNVKTDKITINENLGTDIEDDYIALVYLLFDIKNKKDTGNKLMRMYSDDLAATLANEGIEDVVEIAVFWEDEYNNRSVKYAYEYKDGAFYIMDIAGE